MNEKVLPETLLQLMLNVLAKADSFQYISGIQPFLMSLKGRKYYVYVKNLSSAYFKDRPDTTRAQLPIKDEFSEIKESAYPFIFLGYDRINDVLAYIIHSGFISGYQNRYGDNLKPPTNVYHRMTA